MGFSLKPFPPERTFAHLDHGLASPWGEGKGSQMFSSILGHDAKTDKIAVHRRGVLRTRADNRLYIGKRFNDAGKVSQVLLMDEPEALLIQIEEGGPCPEGGLCFRSDLPFVSCPVSEKESLRSEGEILLHHSRRKSDRHAFRSGLGPASKKLLDNLFIFNPDAGILQESFSRLIDLFDIILTQHGSLLYSKVGFLHNGVLNDFFPRTFRNHSARFKDIGKICNGEGLLSILLDQENGQSLFI